MIRDLLFGEMGAGDGKGPLFLNANQLAHALQDERVYQGNIGSVAAMAAFLSQIFRRQRRCPKELGDAILNLRAVKRRVSAERRVRLRQTIADELEPSPSSREPQRPGDATEELRRLARAAQQEVVFIHRRGPQELSSLLGEPRSRIVEAARHLRGPSEIEFEYYCGDETAAEDFWQTLLNVAEREARDEGEDPVERGSGMVRRAATYGLLKIFVVAQELAVVPVAILNPLSAAEAGFIFFLQGDQIAAACRMDKSTLDTWLATIHRRLREGTLQRTEFTPAPPGPSRSLDSF